MMRRGLFCFATLFTAGFLMSCESSPTPPTATAKEVTLTTTAAADRRLDEATAAFMRMDYSTAAAIWRPLAEQGDPAAEVGMGKLYDSGWGVPKDPIQATAWYQRAADQGLAEGECTLGLRYLQGYGVQFRDLSSGLMLMKKAADQGSGSCAQSIGELYRNGLFGVPKDPAQAAAWHRKGAELGDTLAESRLGIDYQFGIGVLQDSAQATYWYRKAVEQTRQKAEQGDVAAQLRLGNAYETGMMGLPTDKGAALYWCRQAARQESRIKSFAEQCAARIVSQPAAAETK